MKIWVTARSKMAFSKKKKKMYLAQKMKAVWKEILLVLGKDNSRQHYLFKSYKAEKNLTHLRPEEKISTESGVRGARGAVMIK